jgi:multidrug resistance efflux pump
MLQAQGVVKEHERSHRLELRAEVTANRVESIDNKIAWPLILDVVEDGTVVNKGEWVIRFSETDVLQAIEDLNHELKREEIALEQRILNIDGEQHDLREKVEKAKSTLRTLQAKRSSLLAEPLPGKIAAAQSSLEIAKLYMSKAERELKKCERRLEKNMISPSKLEEVKLAVKREKIMMEAAKMTFDLESSAASERSLKINALKIENTEMEIAKLLVEQEKKIEILKLKKKTASAKRERQLKKLMDKKAELEHIDLLAPMDGVVNYTTLRDTLASGGKPRKGQSLMEMPDMNSLVLKGLMPERYGSTFVIGDPVRIRLAHIPEEVFSGELKLVSKKPIDLNHLSIEWGAQGKSSGIKYFEFEVQVHDRVPGLKLGMKPIVELLSARKVKGPAVPLNWLKIENKNFFLKRGNDWEKVEGRAIGDLFFLQDSSWLGVDCSASPSSVEASSPDPKEGGEDVLVGQLSLLGEMQPGEAVEVKVPVPKGGWVRDLKVSWLSEEQELVQAGDTVARLVSESIKKQIEEMIDEVEKIGDELKTAEKDLELSRNERSYQRELLANRLKIAELEHQIVERGMDSSAYIKAKRDLALAELSLEETRAKLARAEDKAALFSPRTLDELRWRLREQELNLEAAQLNSIEVEKGSSALRRFASALNLKRYQHQWQGFVNEDQFILQKFETRKRSLEKRLKRQQKILDRKRHDQLAYEVKAPSSGLLSYCKVWGGAGMIKVKENVNVWPDRALLTISNNSSMVLELEVPEQYYREIKDQMDVKIQVPSMMKQNIKGQVRKIGKIFEEKRRNESEVLGEYTQQEQLGYNIFKVEVDVVETGLNLVSGVLARVIFPIAKS